MKKLAKVNEREREREREGGREEREERKDKVTHKREKRTYMVGMNG
jgi:hypothetical protein